MPIVNAKALVEARKKRGWTQRELSEATKPRIDVSTISRMERGKSSNVRMRSLRELCRVLGTTPDALCSKKEPDRDIVKFNLDSAARNALTLVAQRYGIHRERIIEVAPLLFHIAAEQSLRDRRKRLNDLYDAADAVANFQDQIQHLPRYMLLDEDALMSEQRSIDKRDLFAANVLDKAGNFRGEYSNQFDEAFHNPFVAFLRSALKSIEASEDEMESVQWSPGRRPQYEICADQVERLVGDDARALHAILSGYAALHEMPKASPEERAAWARAEWDRTFGDLEALLEEAMAHGSIDEADATGSSEDVAP